ncbi:MAG: two-component regulator propeller domain-containing protein [Flavobacteriales bacterium]
MATAGYPSNTVRAICQDSLGGTWVGTDWGLCHFDGAAWEVLQVGSGLPENDIRALACDGQGRIWIGLFTQGLVIKDGGTWTQFLPGTSPMPSDQVRNITFDQQGNAWLCTTNGLAWTDLTDWHVYNNTDTSYNNLELPGVNIADVAVRNDGLVCIGTLNAGFTYLTDTLVRVYTTTVDQLPDNTALGVAIDSQGDRWAACPSGGLLHFAAGYNDGLFFQFTTQLSNIPSNALNDIVIDASDQKLIATQNAGFTILSASNNNWTTYNMQNSDLPDDEVNCVSLAPDGTIWVGTGAGGAARFDPFSTVNDPWSEGCNPTAFPNPFRDNVDVRVRCANSGYDWQVNDALGRVVKSGVASPGNDASIAVTGLKKGVYVFIVRYAGIVRALRMVGQ